jgi:hypothetical protein
MRGRGVRRLEGRVSAYLGGGKNRRLAPFRSRVSGWALAPGSSSSCLDCNSTSYCTLGNSSKTANIAR